ncbi:uncharacterized protein LOC131223236 isoform X2 [Magnolia sinica]|uniref:uncharacterized protein LOC131223236 isoform X2 n=1 Tax=Magnolia sinica TaxID=86752 RepID=UPI00265A5D2A|nr:uncharacterized protein LOC131223236 isoform X2 [Magnolia sinica]
MGREKIKSLLSCFTPEGDFLAILSPDGNIKVWNTVSGNLLGEWRDSYGDSAGSYSCIACTFIRKKVIASGAFLLALGTNAGDVLVINILTGEKNWISVGCHLGGTTAVSFAKKGRSLHTTGADGMVSELDSRTGELVGKFKASKKCISSLALSYDEKLLAVGSDKIRVFSLENKRELQKFSADGPIQHIAVMDGGKAVVSSGLGEKQLQVWECNQENRTRISMAVLSMRKPPVMMECKSSFEDEGVVVLSVSEAGTAYIWDLRTTPNQGVTPTRILVKSVRTEMDQQKSAKKNRIPVIAARLRDIEKGARISVIVAYGSPINPQFNILEVTYPGEEVFITAVDETSVPGTAVNPQENGEGNTGMGLHSPKSEGTDPPSQKKREKKKRALSDTDPVSPRNNVDAGHLEIRDGFDIDYDMNEPTMGEKLANLNLVDDATAKSPKKEDLSSNAKPPSADSVHVLLRQALHADDHVLLLDCLYTRDEKVIANSTSMLNPSDVLKFLNSLVSMIQSRGAVLVCAIPWLRSLLLQHAGGIMSQESSLRALNSLYQLIESRVSTFGSALQLSSCLDYHFAGISVDVDDEKSTLLPIIYEDKDESDEESESEDAMETDEESEELEHLGYALDGSDFDGNESMSD